MSSSDPRYPIVTGFNDIPGGYNYPVENVLNENQRTDPFRPKNYNSVSTMGSQQGQDRLNDPRDVGFRNIRTVPFGPPKTRDNRTHNPSYISYGSVSGDGWGKAENRNFYLLDKGTMYSRRSEWQSGPSANNMLTDWTSRNAGWWSGPGMENCWFSEGAQNNSKATGFTISADFIGSEKADQKYLFDIGHGDGYSNNGEGQEYDVVGLSGYIFPDKDRNDVISDTNYCSMGVKYMYNTYRSDFEDAEDIPGIGEGLEHGEELINAIIEQLLEEYPELEDIIGSASVDTLTVEERQAKLHDFFRTDIEDDEFLIGAKSGLSLTDHMTGDFLDKIKEFRIQNNHFGNVIADFLAEWVALQGQRPDDPNLVWDTRFDKNELRNIIKRKNGITGEDFLVWAAKSVMPAELRREYEALLGPDFNITDAIKWEMIPKFGEVKIRGNIGPGTYVGAGPTADKIIPIQKAYAYYSATSSAEPNWSKYNNNFQFKVEARKYYNLENPDKNLTLMMWWSSDTSMTGWVKSATLKPGEKRAVRAKGEVLRFSMTPPSGSGLTEDDFLPNGYIIDFKISDLDGNVPDGNGGTIQDEPDGVELGFSNWGNANGGTIAYEDDQWVCKFEGVSVDLTQDQWFDGEAGYREWCSSNNGRVVLDPNPLGCEIGEDVFYRYGDDMIANKDSQYYTLHSNSLSEPPNWDRYTNIQIIDFEEFGEDYGDRKYTLKNIATTDYLNHSIGLWWSDVKDPTSNYYHIEGTLQIGEEKEILVPSGRYLILSAFNTGYTELQWPTGKGLGTAFEIIDITSQDAGKDINSSEFGVGYWQKNSTSQPNWERYVTERRYDFTTLGGLTEHYDFVNVNINNVPTYKIRLLWSDNQDGPWEEGSLLSINSTRNQRPEKRYLKIGCYDTGKAESSWSTTGERVSFAIGRDADDFSRVIQFEEYCRTQGGIEYDEQNNTIYAKNNKITYRQWLANEEELVYNPRCYYQGDSRNEPNWNTYQQPLYQYDFLVAGEGINKEYILSNSHSPGLTDFHLNLWWSDNGINFVKDGDLQKGESRTFKVEKRYLRLGAINTGINYDDWNIFGESCGFRARLVTTEPDDDTGSSGDPTRGECPVNYEPFKVYWGDDRPNNEPNWTSLDAPIDMLPSDAGRTYDLHNAEPYDIQIWKSTAVITPGKVPTNSITKGAILRANGSVRISAPTEDTLIYLASINAGNFGLIEEDFSGSGTFVQSCLRFTDITDTLPPEFTTITIAGRTIVDDGDTVDYKATVTSQGVDPNTYTYKWTVGNNRSTIVGQDNAQTVRVDFNGVGDASIRCEVSTTQQNVVGDPISDVVDVTVQQKQQKPDPIGAANCNSPYFVTKVWAEVNATSHRPAAYEEYSLLPFIKLDAENAGYLMHVQDVYQGIDFWLNWVKPDPNGSGGFPYVGPAERIRGGVNKVNPPAESIFPDNQYRAILTVSPEYILFDENGEDISSICAYPESVNYNNPDCLSPFLITPTLPHKENNRPDDSGAAPESNFNIPIVPSEDPNAKYFFEVSTNSNDVYISFLNSTDGYFIGDPVYCPKGVATEFQRVSNYLRVAQAGAAADGSDTICAYIHNGYQEELVPDPPNCNTPYTAGYLWPEDSPLNHRPDLSGQREVDGQVVIDFFLIQKNNHPESKYRIHYKNGYNFDIYINHATIENTELKFFGPNLAISPGETAEFLPDERSLAGGYYQTMISAQSGANIAADGSSRICLYSESYIAVPDIECPQNFNKVMAMYGDTYNNNIPPYENYESQQPVPGIVEGQTYQFTLGSTAEFDVRLIFSNKSLSLAGPNLTAGPIIEAGQTIEVTAETSYVYLSSVNARYYGLTEASFPPEGRPVCINANLVEEPDEGIECPAGYFDFPALYGDTYLNNIPADNYDAYEALSVAPGTDITFTNSITNPPGFDVRIIYSTHEFNDPRAIKTSGGVVRVGQTHSEVIQQPYIYFATVNASPSFNESDFTPDGKRFCIKAEITEAPTGPEPITKVCAGTDVSNYKIYYGDGRPGNVPEWEKFLDSSIPQDFINISAGKYIIENKERYNMRLIVSRENLSLENYENASIFSVDELYSDDEVEIDTNDYAGVGDLYLYPSSMNANTRGLDEEQFIAGVEGCIRISRNDGTDGNTGATGATEPGSQPPNTQPDNPNDPYDGLGVCFWASRGPDKTTQPNWDYYERVYTFDLGAEWETNKFNFFNESNRLPEGDNFDLTFWWADTPDARFWTTNGTGIDENETVEYPDGVPGRFLRLAAWNTKVDQVVWSKWGEPCGFYFSEEGVQDDPTDQIRGNCYWQLNPLSEPNWNNYEELQTFDILDKGDADSYFRFTNGWLYEGSDNYDLVMWWADSPNSNIWYKGHTIPAREGVDTFVEDYPHQVKRFFRLGAVAGGSVTEESWSKFGQPSGFAWNRIEAPVDDGATGATGATQPNPPNDMPVGPGGVCYWAQTQYYEPNWGRYTNIVIYDFGEDWREKTIDVRNDLIDDEDNFALTFWWAPREDNLVWIADGGITEDQKFRTKPKDRYLRLAGWNSPMPEHAWSINGEPCGFAFTEVKDLNSGDSYWAGRAVQEPNWSRYNKIVTYDIRDINANTESWIDFKNERVENAHELPLVLWWADRSDASFWSRGSVVRIGETITEKPHLGNRYLRLAADTSGTNIPEEQWSVGGEVSGFNWKIGVAPPDGGDGSTGSTGSTGPTGGGDPLGGLNSFIKDCADAGGVIITLPDGTLECTITGDIFDPTGEDGPDGDGEPGDGEVIPITCPQFFNSIGCYYGDTYRDNKFDAALYGNEPQYQTVSEGGTYTYESTRDTDFDIRLIYTDVNYGRPGCTYRYGSTLR